MSKPLTSSLRKSAIDIDFYNQLANDRAKQLAGTQTDTKPQVIWPELHVTKYFGSALPIIKSTSVPVKAHTPPRLKRHPGIETMPLPRSPRGIELNEIEERESLPHEYSSVDLVLPELPNDDDEEVRKVSDGTSQSPSPGRSSSQSGAATPVSPTTSSVSSSPATTPRGDDGREKRHGMRKLQRKITQKAEDLATAVHEAFSGLGTQSPTNSGERGSPKQPISLRVRFGAIDPVDISVALDDAEFYAFVTDNVKIYFNNTWGHDGSAALGSTGVADNNADKLRPTFIRDFRGSKYFFRNDKHELIELKSTDEFIAFIGADRNDEFVKRVSNIASQNLSHFLQSVLFVREDAQKKSHSILRLSDGTPISPVAKAKASYVFSTDVDGRLVLDYQRKSSLALNGINPMKAKTIGEYPKTFEVSDEAELTISMRVTFESDGQCQLGNPRIQAKAWVPAETT